MHSLGQDADSEENVLAGVQGLYGNSLCSVPLCCEPNTALKIKSIFKKFNEKTFKYLLHIFKTACNFIDPLASKFLPSII